jgi:uncharacterized membrane protein YvbJ
MEEFKFCSSCGEKVPIGTKFCPNCGKALFPEEKPKKFCQHCGEEIDKDCVVCPKCGKQVSELKSEQPTVVIQNNNTNTNINRTSGKEKDKWVAFFLCLFLGLVGAHKFYEGKIGMGILYIFTGGLFLVGAIIDLISILSKPNPYYV